MKLQVDSCRCWILKGLKYVIHFNPIQDNLIENQNAEKIFFKINSIVESENNTHNTKPEPHMR